MRSYMKSSGNPCKSQPPVGFPPSYAPRFTLQTCLTPTCRWRSEKDEPSLQIVDLGTAVEATVISGSCTSGLEAWL